MGKVRKSPWVLHYDGSSCNGCDIEVLACLTPVYDAERFGIINTGDPLQADIFLITGGINTQNRAVVEQLYDQMPRPKVVVAVGTCACTGGIFKECYNILGGADTTVPVDIYVPGCAARPQAIIDGLIQAIELFQKRSNRHERIERRHREKEKEEKKERRAHEKVSATTSHTNIRPCVLWPISGRRSQVSRRSFPQRSSMRTRWRNCSASKYR